jgi:hypothetical protein
MLFAAGTSFRSRDALPAGWGDAMTRSMCALFVLALALAVPLTGIAVATAD